MYIIKNLARSEEKYETYEEALDAATTRSKKPWNMIDEDVFAVAEIKTVVKSQMDPGSVQTAVVEEQDITKFLEDNRKDGDTL